MRRLVALPGLALLVLVATPVQAGGLSATAAGEARAEVVAPLVVTREADLDFGAILAGAASGAVTISAAGGADYSGGAEAACVGGTCAASHAARFSVQGESGRSYVVTVPGGVTAYGTAMQAGDTAPPLAVEALTVRSDSRPESGAGGLLDSAGRDAFQVGGTLQIPARLPAARYRATVPVMVTYG